MVLRTEEKAHRITNKLAAEVGAHEAAQPMTTLVTVRIDPGTLGLTVRIDPKLGGALITAIGSACAFKNHVGIGDVIVSIDGKPINAIADLQVNNTKTRQLGIAVRNMKDSTKPAPPSPSSSSQQLTTAATPLPTAGHPIVTTEKKKSTKNDEDQPGKFNVFVHCPDGSVIFLSSDQSNDDNIPSHIVLGRGNQGIPLSAALVLPVACVLRIVEKCNNDDDYGEKTKSNEDGSSKQFALELVSLGTERCTVLRDGQPLFVTNIAQILANGKDTASPSSMIIRNGDIIEPCDREKVTASNANHYEFKVQMTGANKDKRSANPCAKGTVKPFVNPYLAKGTEKPTVNPYLAKGTEKPTVNSYVKSTEKPIGDPSASNPFDFDKESLRNAFLHRPKSTANFFVTYHKFLSKKTPNSNAESLNAFIDAMSLQVNASEGDVCVGQKLDHFPLKEILTILVEGKNKELLKRAIEGYISLSCLKFTAKSESGLNSPSGPILLASSNLPLASMCNTIGWDYLEPTLVNAVEMLCKYQKTSIRALALVEKVEPTTSGANSRVFCRMIQVAYEKCFTAEPEATARHFIRFQPRVVERSYETGVKLLNAFVDAMSPSDIASRRVPEREIDTNFPLKDILAIIVNSKDKELGKRVFEGYVWLSSQRVVIKGIGATVVHIPKGPLLFARWDFPLLDMCDKIGWETLGDVLVDSIEKLYELNNSDRALELIQKIMQKIACMSSSSDECPRMCVRMAKVAIKKVLNPSTFKTHPNLIAKFFVTQYLLLEKDSSNDHLCGDLLNAFVDMMSPKNQSNKSFIVFRVDGSFPLKDILAIIAKSKHMELGKKVFESYVWLTEGCTWLRLIQEVEVPLISLCDSLGWNEFENVLVKSVETLCKNYLTEVAVNFVDKLTVPTSKGHGDRFRICSIMANIACDKMIGELDRSRRFKEPSLFPLYKKLLRLVGNYCPAAIATKFVALGKNLDVDKMLFPLLTDASLRSSSSADVMKNTLSELTIHCAKVLHSRVLSDPNIVTAWSISNASQYRSTEFGEFLQNQCKKTFDWKVRKSDHQKFQYQLRALINAGEVDCLSHRQNSYSGPYYFKVTKLKTQRVTLSALSCSCSRISVLFSSKGTQTPPDCLRESSQRKRQRDEMKLNKMKEFLTSEQISSHLKKRKAVDALSEGNDDVVFSGVADVAEAVAKRVKAAEDAGEVIEIL